MSIAACLCLLFLSRSVGSLPRPRAAPPALSVSCSGGALRLRVAPPSPGAPSGSGLLRLGRRCRSNGVDRATGELLFTYPLSACDSARQVRREFLLYRFVLRYGGGRVHVECRLNRLRHVHRLAVRPTWESPLRLLLKGPTVGYGIRLLDERRAASQHRVNVQVSAVHLPPRGRLYVDRCHAAPSAEPRRGPRRALIQNFGCMVEPSGSFTRRTRRTINYVFDASRFTREPAARVFLHCRLFVSAEGPGPTAKSCSYSSEEKRRVPLRWRSLAGPHSICDCCDSLCVPNKGGRSTSEEFQSSSPLVFTAQVSRPRSKEPPTSPSPGFLDDVTLSEVKTGVDEDPAQQDARRHGRLSSPSGEGVKPVWEWVGPRPQADFREAVSWVVEARFLSDHGEPQEGGLSDKSVLPLQRPGRPGLSAEGRGTGWAVEGEGRRSEVEDVLFLNGYDGPPDV